uniref:Kazal-like domain-containing protein n=1 Tax=Castor canadensis TaxID=51338 RepID=A0A8C0WT25_CASCN
MEKTKMFFLAILVIGCFSYVFGDSFKVISCDYYRSKLAQKKRICSIRVSPVCASNTVTYPNSCVYCFANIALNHTLKVQYHGICQKPIS